MSTETFNRKMKPATEGPVPAETVQLADHQGVTAQADEQVPSSLDLSNLQFSVKSTDMTENTVLFVVEKTILAFEKSDKSLFESKKNGFEQDRDSLICKQLKFYMDSFYKPSWHAISGENYGSFFTHVKGSFIVFTFQGKWITLFRTA